MTNTIPYRCIQCSTTFYGDPGLKNSVCLACQCRHGVTVSAHSAGPHYSFEATATPLRFISSGAVSTPPPETFVKHDAGKPELDLLALIPDFASTQIARALRHGGEKYGFHNFYKKGATFRRYGAALLRHTFAWLRGEDFDPESGLHHLAHAGACVVILLALIDRKAGEDDRFNLAEPKNPPL